MNELTQAEVQRLLHYDPETGMFTNRIPRGASSKPGTRAGSKNQKGYWSIGIEGRYYGAHRLAWLYSYSVWPPGQIDHIDGVKDNNCLSNLRLATPSENQQNRSVQANNELRIRGVCFAPTNCLKPWRAQLKINKKFVLARYFATLEEATAARREAELKYHPFSKVHTEVEDLTETA